MAQLMPLPLTVSCSCKIQIGFTFLVLAHLGSPGQRVIKRVCVCVCVRACVRVCVLIPFTANSLEHVVCLSQLGLVPWVVWKCASFVVNALRELVAETGTEEQGVLDMSLVSSVDMATPVRYSIVIVLHHLLIVITK